MENFTYCAPTKYVFGRDAELQAADQLKQIGATRILVCYGGGSAVRSGLLECITRQLTDNALTFKLLGGIQPNPTDPKVREGIAICREERIDAILAVGGGSVIDTAKAIAAGVPYPGDFWDFWAGKATITEALPVGVVLTIPAAGSEGSGNSVITRVDGLLKISLRTDMVLRPKFALLNPELTFSLPAAQTAAGIADMMAHILERYFSPTTDCEVTDRLAEGLLMAIIAEAPKVIENPTDYQARANIMWSGTLAHNGLCGTGRTEDWVSHAMEHEISALYNVAHGAGLAVVFPAWMAFMANHAPARIAQLARRVFAIDDPNDGLTAIMGIARLRQFFRSLGLPLTFADLGISTPNIPLMVKKLHATKGEHFGGYMQLSAAETTEIYNMMMSK